MPAWKSAGIFSVLSIFLAGTVFYLPDLAGAIALRATGLICILS